MKKYVFTCFAALGLGVAFGQNYVAGPTGVYGQQYAAATTIGSSGSVTVGAAGVWAFGGPVTSTPRSTTNGVAFMGGGTYSGASATNFIDGYVAAVGSTAFTYPVGDGTAASGNQYHPVAVSALGSASTVTISYNATTTPGNTRAQLSVDSIDALAYYTLASTVSTTGTATASVRNEAGAFKTNATLFAGGYNIASSKWQDLRGTSSMTTAPQDFVTQSLDLSQYSAFTVAAANPLTVSPYVLLQGAASGTVMTTGLHNVIPLAQPYTISNFAYTGIETIASVPTNMTDWIMVELRSPSSPTTVIATRAALLLSDGTITDVDGVSAVSFPGQAAGNYYVALRHRNHLGIRSASQVALNGLSSMVLDFRQSQPTAYQNTAITSNPAMKDLGNGYFAMYGGNANGNTSSRVSGTQLLSDYLYLSNTALSGNNTTITPPIYSSADMNMNGVVRVSGTQALSDYLFLSNVVLSGNNSLILTQHN